MVSEFRFDRTDRDATLQTLERILEMSPAQQTELVLEAGHESLTRFAGNRIHQNVKESDLTLSVRAIEDGHVGYGSTNHLGEQSVKHALQWAADVARSRRIPAQPPELAGPQQYVAIDNHVQATAALAPHMRAEIVKNLAERCFSQGAEAAGAVSNSESILAIANSRGLRAYHVSTDSNFTATVSSQRATGWCSCHALDASQLEAEAMGRRALERAVAGRNPRTIEPGKYTVILEEAAVKDFIDFLCWLGFGAQSFEEGRSFLCKKIDTEITGTNITITDDVYHPLASGVPFDYEGMPRQRVVLIEKGVARNVVYDRAYAERAQKTSTGHALPTRFAYGPLPMNPVMMPGASDISQMLRSVTRGLLVSRFWYCRVVDPAKTLLTGQTRDGTFLIENGKIACAVRDMRFNESILEAFARAELISKDVRRIESTIVPAVKIADFRFTESVGMH